MHKLGKVGLAKVVPPRMASFEHIVKYHDKDYVDVLRGKVVVDEREMEKEWGLGDDCDLPSAHKREEFWRYLRCEIALVLHCTLLPSFLGTIIDATKLTPLSR